MLTAVKGLLFIVNTSLIESSVDLIPLLFARRMNCTYSLFYGRPAKRLGLDYVLNVRSSISH
jgi:hypothetical protein